jgi:hypothetical protein
MGEGVKRAMKGAEEMMMPAKIRVEVLKDDLRITSMESVFDSVNEALASFATLVNFLVTKRSSLPADIPYDLERDDLTIKERLASFLRFDERAPKEWFTSSQIKRKYEEAFDANVRLTTISTYLASMHSEGILERKGNRAKWQYRVVPTGRMEVPRAVNVV